MLIMTKFEVNVNTELKKQKMSIVDLAEMIESRNISQYPITFYLIGFEGKVNIKMHSENYYSAMFRELRKKAGLTDKFTLYGLKHTRVIHLINAGIMTMKLCN